MAEKVTVETLLQRNRYTLSNAPKLNIESPNPRKREYAISHQPLPLLAELKAMGLPAPRKDRILVITCADHRSVPEDFLRLQTRDAVLVMRNVCGHVEPILTGILALDYFVKFSDILIIHHTDCGASHFKEADIRAELKARAPGHAEVDTMEFGAINDIEQSVRDDIRVLRISPFIKKELAERTVGFVYNLKTGLLYPVED
ncbi:hypothetical protein AOQ84DRAFT_421415 [Glonium stellatum]|uniref:Carbonic anhydrase n=1 Tax=Glonium stellatum TaxID=574774 RepID=A0A8E2JN62_9PEZI|nr:hypothetical protein AOQ84DRAFT_421415 [Glonium stellatum]